METNTFSPLLQLRIRHLRLLEVIHATGSLRRAAAELCLTQPAVTAMLKDLEHAFGNALVVRDSHGARLTAAGQALRIRLGAVMEALRDAADESLQQAGVVRLRVGAMLATMFDLIPRTVSRLHREGDPIDVKLRDGTIRRMIGALLDDEVDCVVGRLDGVEIDRRVQAELHEEPLLSTPIGVACARDHPLAAAGAASLAQLVEQDWVLLPPGSQSRQVFNSALMQEGLPPVRPVVESESLATNFHIVAGSSLLTLAPRSAIALYGEFGMIRELPLDIPLAISPLSFICHVQKRRLHAMERFRQVLVQTAAGIAARQA